MKRVFEIGIAIALIIAFATVKSNFTLSIQMANGAFWAYLAYLLTYYEKEAWDE